MRYIPKIPLPDEGGYDPDHELEVPTSIRVHEFKALRRECHVT